MQTTTTSIAKTSKRSKPGACKVACHSNLEHPDHAAVLVRLNRAAGQIKGVSAMIQERRYCVDILTQLKAAQSAIRHVEAEIMERHIRSCIQDAFTSKNPREMEKKIQELVKLMT